ncbi:A1 cistron-splicing factor [Exophiala viscosa]|uniref:A1 cistron-splicing factor n=1 Tax=Exophiala viscosa TaxID=2486360 RepID=UPI0021955B2A|nr:A1 cistron-splicing factor [Exophiala viscosa]
MASQLENPTVLLLSLPPKTFIGLDLLSFNSSPNFQGITNIPVGLHFLYTGTDASLSIRHGRWLNVRRQCLVLQWNSATENLDLLEPDSQTAQSAIRSVSRRGLVDYTALQDATSDLSSQQQSEQDDPTSQQHDDHRAESTDWPSLTSHLTSSLLTRLLSPAWIISSISTAPADTEHIPGLSHLETDNALRQSPLDLLPINLKQTWSEGDIGRTRTDRARDRSWYLEQLVDNVTPSGADRTVGAKQVLGELQFCFLMVLTLANYSCLEQWKRLLTVMFTCRTALIEIEAYFVEAVKVLRMQARHIEDVDGGLFEMRDESASSWLRSVWGKFRALVDETFTEDTSGGQALKAEIEALQKFFEEKYGWQSERDTLRRGMLELEDGERIEVSMQGVDEDEEKGEYAPLIVDT